MVYPIVDSVYLSLHSWGGVGAMKWVAFSNYTTFLSSSDFAQSTEHSLVICALATAFSIGIGVILAGAIHFHMPAHGFVRTACFLPVMIPFAATATFWTTAFNPFGGIVNAVLGSLGLGGHHLFLGSPNTAIYTLIFVAVWTQAGFAMIFILAAMDAIPSEVYESAMIDGASLMRRFFSFTLPLSRRMVAVVGMLELIYSFRLFTEVWTMTEGGPGTATEIFPTVIYKDAFLYDQFGYGAAIAVVSAVLVLALLVLYVRIFRPFKVMT
jgi:ABC-type sugar transport system permease subunit